MKAYKQVLIENRASGSVYCDGNYLNTQLSDLLNDGWVIERCDTVAGIEFSKYSGGIMIYIFSKETTK